MSKISSEDIKKEAIRIVNQERVDWEDAVAFVTDKVAFNMRNLIRQLRRNYWGVFEQPNDPNTGRKKIFVPLTQSLVNAVVKNIDLDTKDITFRAKKPEAIGLTHVVRSIVRASLDEMGESGTSFGEELDMLEKDLAIDGTAVWKTTEETVRGKRRAIVRKVDLLNVYIDPTAESIQKAYRFTERAAMTENEVKSMNGWMNTDEVKGFEGMSRFDSLLTSSSSTNPTKLIDVWETWGQIPKWIITGKEEDRKSGEIVEGRIVVSGLERHGSERVHVIEKNLKEIKPYEEAWYSRTSTRWYGVGVAEMIMMLQLYINTIVNIRVNRSYVSQLGLFKIRKGAGLTPQMFSRLASNGAVLVNSMDDIEQMVFNEASQASYTDESNIVSWSERVTSAFESVTGESLPASTPATNAVLSNRAATSTFIMVKESIGMFLRRWIRRQYNPILMKTINVNDLVRITGSVEELLKVNTNLANSIVRMELEKKVKRGEFVSSLDVERERQRLIKKLSNQGERFIKLLKKPDLLKYEVDVNITNESIDKGVLAQNLITALQTAPQLQGLIIPQIFDIMGLPIPESIPQLQTGQGGQLPSAPTPKPQTGQGVTTTANTLPN